MFLNSEIGNMANFQHLILVITDHVQFLQTFRRFRTASHANAGSPGPLEINKPS